MKKVAVTENGIDKDVLYHKIIDVSIKWLHISKGDSVYKSFQLFMHFNIPIISLIIYLKIV